MQISSSNSLAMDVGVDSNSVGPKKMEAAVDQTEFISCFASNVLVLARGSDS